MPDRSPHRRMTHVARPTSLPTQRIHSLWTCRLWSWVQDRPPETARNIFAKFPKRCLGRERIGRTAVHGLGGEPGGRRASVPVPNEGVFKQVLQRIRRPPAPCPFPSTRRLPTVNRRRMAASATWSIAIDGARKAPTSVGNSVGEVTMQCRELPTGLVPTADGIRVTEIPTNQVRHLSGSLRLLSSLGSYRN